MKVFLKILIVVAILSFVACESDNVEITEFKGVVLSYSTLEPISNIQLVIGQYDSFDNRFSSNFIYDTVKTNNDGTYSCKLPVNDKPYYTINILNEDYITIYRTIHMNEPEFNIKQSSVNVDTLMIGEPAFLKLNLLNNKEDLNDSIFVSINRELTEITEEFVFSSLPSWGPYVLRLYPQYNDTTVLYKLSYDLFKPAIIYWSISDKEEFVVESSEKNLIPRDTATFTIEF